MIYKFTFRAFIIITAIICLSACSTDNANNVEFRLDYTRLQDLDPEAISKKVFKDAQILECSQEILDEVIDNREVELLAKDGILVVKSLEKFEGSYLINLFDLESLTPKGKVAPFGPGPDEFTDTRIIKSNEDGTICYVLSLGKNKLFKLTSDLNLEYYTTIPTPINDDNFLMGFEALEMISPDTILATQRKSDALGICTISLRDSIATGILAFDFTNDLNGYWPVYLGVTTYNQVHQKLVYGFNYYNQIVFSNISGNNMVIFRGDDYGGIKAKNKSEFWESGNNVYYYSDLFSDDNYVYALYRGAPYNPEFSDNDFYYIEVFSWLGESIKRFKLPNGMQFSKGIITKEIGDTRIIYLINPTEDQFLYKVTIKI